MKTGVRIALVGDYNPATPAHVAIPRALELAADRVGCAIAFTWTGTLPLVEETARQLAECQGVWCVPDSPYRSMEGALRAIEYARRNGRPFLGTCGGFQHALIEYARNVLGLRDADHAESNPTATMPLVSRLSCSLVEVTGSIRLRPGMKAHAICGQNELIEAYHCNFGLTPRYRAALEDGNLRISGEDPAGDARVIELSNHPFFLATLFQPERAALSGRAHPIIAAFVRAAADNRQEAGHGVTPLQG
jgi:CTP synthase (UTP-ammonia lyase)